MGVVLRAIGQRFNLQSLLAALLLFGAVVNFAGSVEHRSRMNLTTEDATGLVQRAYRKTQLPAAASLTCTVPIERERDWLVNCSMTDAQHGQADVVAVISKRTLKTSVSKTGS